jgi:predicted butyrate kinase (DUF1464 family)
MTINIGVDYTAGQWKSCVVGQGHLAELHIFATSGEMLASLSQVCALYPEPTIVLALDATVPFGALQDLTDEQLERLAQSYRPVSSGIEVREALEAFGSLSLHCYSAPSVVYLPSVSHHRRLMRPSLGSAREVCAVVALLHHMREQEAAWQEMNFLFVNASEQGTSTLVLQAGQIINGIGALQGSSFSAVHEYLAGLEIAGGWGEEDRQDRFQRALQEAFWEGLTQELGGLMTIHHIEDVVVLGQKSGDLIERLADVYQVYLFPHAQTDYEGYESALGAALLAEGLDQPGKAAELVDYLQIRHAGPIGLASGD